MLGLARIAEKGPMVAIGLAIGLLFLAMILSPLIAFFSLPVLVLSGAVMAYVCLRFGEQAAIQALVGGALVLFLMSFLLQGSVWQLPLTGMLLWLPPAIAALALRYTTSLPISLLVIAAFGIAVAMVVQMNADAIVAYWQKSVSVLMEVMAEQRPDLMAGENFGQKLEQLLDVMLGATGVTVMVLAVGCLFIARSWQAQLFNVGGFQKEFHALTFGSSAGLVALAIIALSMFSEIGWLDAIAFVVIFLLGLQGLAVVHSLVKRRGLSTGVLVVMYTFCILPQVILLIAVLGLCDNFYPLRKS